VIRRGRRSHAAESCPPRDPRSCLLRICWNGRTRDRALPPARVRCDRGERGDASSLLELTQIAPRISDRQLSVDTHRRSTNCVTSCLFATRVDYKQPDPHDAGWAAATGYPRTPRSSSVSSAPTSNALLPPTVDAFSSG